MGIITEKMNPPDTAVKSFLTCLSVCAEMGVRGGRLGAGSLHGTEIVFTELAGSKTHWFKLSSDIEDLEFSKRNGQNQGEKKQS